MKFATVWGRWMKRWRVARPARALPPPDPADCGTAWGLELTIPKLPEPRRPRRR